MTDEQFLSSYDPDAFPRVAVTVDTVLLSVVEGRLVVLLQRRTQAPAQSPARR